MNDKTYTPDPKLKGQLNGNCNRTDCQQPNAIYYNFITRLYYCKECAELLNEVNPEALTIYGHELCIEENQMLQYKDLK